MWVTQPGYDIRGTAKRADRFVSASQRRRRWQGDASHQRVDGTSARATTGPPSRSIRAAQVWRCHFGRTCCMAGAAPQGCRAKFRANARARSNGGRTWRRDVPTCRRVCVCVCSSCGSAAHKRADADAGGCVIYVRPSRNGRRAPVTRAALGLSVSLCRPRVRARASGTALPVSGRWLGRGWCAHAQHPSPRDPSTCQRQHRHPNVRLLWVRVRVCECLCRRSDVCTRQAQKMLLIFVLFFVFKSRLKWIFHYHLLLICKHARVFAPSSD